MKQSFTGFIFTILLFQTLISHGQWEQVEGEYGNKINDILYANGVLSLATDSGIFFSHDLSDNWNFTKSKFATSAHYLASNGFKFYAGSDSGVYTSPDFISWKKIKNGNSTLLLASNSLLFHYNNVSKNSTSISKDEGVNWSTLDIGNGTIVTACSNSSGFYFGSSQYQGLMKYSNKGLGQTPQLISNTKASNWYVSALDCNEKYICAVATAQNDTFIFSQNAGKSWSAFPLPVSEGNSISQNGNYLLKIIDSNIVLSNKTNIYITYDKGANWTKIISGLSPSETTCLELAEGYLLAGLIGSGGKAVLYKRKLTDFNGITYNGNGILEAPFITGATYQWFLNNTLISESGINTIQAPSGGSYQVKINYSDNLSTAPAIKSFHYSYLYGDLITAQFTGTEMIKRKNIIYKDGYIDIPEFKDQEQYYSITNCAGQVLSKGQVNESKIYTGSLGKGIYMLHVTDAYSFHNERFFVE